MEREKGPIPVINMPTTAFLPSKGKLSAQAAMADDNVSAIEFLVPRARRKLKHTVNSNPLPCLVICFPSYAAASRSANGPVDEQPAIIWRAVETALSPIFVDASGSCLSFDGRWE